MGAPSITPVHIPTAAKRRIAAAARRRGVSTEKFILDAALSETDPQAVKLARLAASVEKVRAAVEDELDYRLADARWRYHVKHKTRLLTGQEVWCELGLQD
jgi:hypothetical protein